MYGSIDSYWGQYNFSRVFSEHSLFFSDYLDVEANYLKTQVDPDDTVREGRGAGFLLPNLSCPRPHLPTDVPDSHYRECLNLTRGPGSKGEKSICLEILNFKSFCWFCDNNSFSTFVPNILQGTGWWDITFTKQNELSKIFTNCPWLYFLYFITRMNSG